MDFNKINISKLEPTKKKIGLAAGIGILGSFMPWATIPIIGGVSGTKMGAWLIIILLGVVIALTLEGEPTSKLNKKNTKIALGASSLATLYVIFRFINFNSGSYFSGGFGAGLGLGIWITLIASIVCTFFLLKEYKN